MFVTAVPALAQWEVGRHFAAPGPPEGITIYTAKKILTMERSNPEATAVAVAGKRILAVGSLEDVKADAMVRSASVLKRHIPLSFHSDLPMGPSAPLNFVWCAVNRVTPSGRVAGPDQRIGVEDALRAVTIESAYSWRKETELGSIAPGKIANFTVLEQDPLAVEPMKLKDIPIWGTVFEGRVFPIPARDSQSVGALGGPSLGYGPWLGKREDTGDSHSGCPCEVARIVAAALMTNR